MLKPPQQQPQQQPMRQNSLSDLERTFQAFQQPGPSQPPQQPAAGGGLDLSKLLAVVNARNQMQQAPSFAQQGQVPGQPPNLAAMLSQFRNQRTAAPSAYGYGQQNQYGEDYDRKRMREDPDWKGEYDDYGNSEYGYKRQKANIDNNKAKKHVRTVMNF